MINPMINSLRIRNFKSIVDAQLEFGRVNLFIGVNGTGKSNLLEAIGLYTACLGRGIDANILSSKGVRLSAASILKSSFRRTLTPALIRLHGSMNGLRYVTALRATENSPLKFYTEALTEGDSHVLIRHPIKSWIELGNSSQLDAEKVNVEANPHRGLWDTHGSLASVTPSTRVLLNRVAQYVIYSPQTAVMRDLVPDSRVIEPLGLTGSRLPQAVREVLIQRRSAKQMERDITKILEIIWQPGWAKQVRVGPPQPSVIPDALSSKKEVLYIIDKYMKTNRNALSLYDASEGTLFLLFVATILAHAGSPPIFALDNVDGTLNPSMVRTVTEITLPRAKRPKRSKTGCARGQLTTLYPSLS